MTIHNTHSSTENSKQYWAFISYSSLDKKYGSWLHKKLENYPIPEEFRNTELFDGAVLGRNLRPIFRDRDELSGSSELGPAIAKALRSSRFLIVLCSRNSASSEWVNKEIEDFKALKKGNDKRILALIIDGEPNASSNINCSDNDECFPPALRYPLEPLAGDLRKEGDGKERGFLKVLAGITELDFDRLYRRHERAQQKKRVFIASLAVLFIAILTSLSIFAFNQKTLAEQQTKLSEEHSAKKVQAQKEALQNEKEANKQRILAIENANKEAIAKKEAAKNQLLFLKNRSWSQFHQAQKLEANGDDLKAIAYYGSALETSPSEYEIGITALYKLANTSSYSTASTMTEKPRIISQSFRIEEGQSFNVDLYSRKDQKPSYTYTINDKKIITLEVWDKSTTETSPESFESIRAATMGSTSSSNALVCGYGNYSEFSNSGGVFIFNQGEVEDIPLQDCVHTLHMSEDGCEFIACAGFNIFCFRRSANPSSNFRQVWKGNFMSFFPELVEEEGRFPDGSFPMFAGYDTEDNLIFEIRTQSFEISRYAVSKRLNKTLMPEIISKKINPFKAPNVVWDADHENLEFLGFKKSTNHKKPSHSSNKYQLNCADNELAPNQALEVYSVEPKRLLFSHSPKSNQSLRGSLIFDDTFLIIDESDGSVGLNGLYLRNPRIGSLYQPKIEASAGPFSWSPSKNRLYFLGGPVKDSADYILATDILGDHSPIPEYIPLLCYLSSGLQPDEIGRLVSLSQLEKTKLLSKINSMLKQESNSNNAWSKFAKWYLIGQYKEHNTVTPYSETSAETYVTPKIYRYKISNNQPNP